MESSGVYTRHEIASQPEAWGATLSALAEQQAALGDFFRAGAFDSVIFTGCGSTYYLAMAAAAVVQELCGLPARGLPASELWLDLAAAARVGHKPLLVAVSRSGATSETLRACAGFQAAGGALLTLSCYPEQPLATLGEHNLVLPAGQEQSIAQTRAFSTLYLATLFAAATWAGRDDLLTALEGLPAAGRRALSAGAELAQSLGADQSIDRMYLLGSGTRYALACELSLKLKEMSLTHSEPFHVLEFRHGPKSMVTPSTLIVALRSEQRRAHEQAVLDELRAQGGRVLTIAEDEAEIAFASGLPEVLRGPLYLPPGHQLAFERAVAQGLDPDHPRNLDAVVRLQ